MQPNQLQRVIPSSQSLPELRWFDQAERALEKATQLDELKAIRDQASAFYLYARQSRRSLQVQNKLACIRFRCERRLGSMLKEKLHRGRPKRLRDATFSLGELDV